MGHADLGILPSFAVPPVPDAGAKVAPGVPARGARSSGVRPTAAREDPQAIRLTRLEGSPREMGERHGAVHGEGLRAVLRRYEARLGRRGLVRGDVGGALAARKGR